MRSGKNPLVQIPNGLAIAKRYGDMLDDEENEIDNYFFKLCAKHRLIKHPALRLKGYEKTTRLEKAICHGTTVTNK